jgi:hypothetical protein
MGELYHMVCRNDSPTLEKSVVKHIIVRNILIHYNPLDDPVPFFTGDDIFHYEVFQ